MVGGVFAPGRSGVQDWLRLRASAVCIILYIFYILCFVITTPEITYEIWRGFFSSLFTKIFTVLTLLAVLIHTWIGMWQVLTDYIKPVARRRVLQRLIIITLLLYFLYGSLVVWGA